MRRQLNQNFFTLLSIKAIMEKLSFSIEFGLLYCPGGDLPFMVEGFGEYGMIGDISLKASIPLTHPGSILIKIKFFIHTLLHSLDLRLKPLSIRN